MTYSKTPWIIGLVITVILLWGSEFSDTGDCGDITSVNGGFCVTSFDCKGKFLEAPVFTPPNIDSHTMAGLVDAALMVVATALPILDKVLGVKIFNIGNYKYKSSWSAFLQAISLIGIHGYAHFFTLAESYDAPNNSDGILNDSGGDDIFLILSVVITAVLMYESGLREMLNSHAKMIGIIAVVSWALIQLVERTDNSPISLFFILTQLLVTGTATIIPNKESPVMDELMGWGFAATCTVSLLEFYFCQSFLLKIGGHVWYDLALHCTLLTAYWVYDDEKIYSGFLEAVSLPLI